MTDRKLVAQMAAQIAAGLVVGESHLVTEEDAGVWEHSMARSALGIVESIFSLMSEGLGQIPEQREVQPSHAVGTISREDARRAVRRHR